MRKVPGSKSPLIGWAGNSIYLAANGNPTLFRAGEGLGCEGRRDEHHPSHSMPSDTCGTLTFTAPTANRLWDLPLPFLPLHYKNILVCNCWKIILNINIGGSMTLLAHAPSLATPQFWWVWKHTHPQFHTHTPYISSLANMACNCRIYSPPLIVLIQVLYVCKYEFIDVQFILLRSIHTTPQLCCGVDTSITFAASHHSFITFQVKTYLTLVQHRLTQQRSNIANFVQNGAVPQHNAIAA